MNRTILLTAAGLVSAAVVGAGCEQDRSSNSARMGSARGEAVQATGQPGTGAKHGTGTSASGVMTGNATTGAGQASAKVDAGSPGQTGSETGRGPGSIAERNTDDIAGTPAAPVVGSSGGGAATASPGTGGGAAAQSESASNLGPGSVDAPASGATGAPAGVAAAGSTSAAPAPGYTAKDQGPANVDRPAAEGAAGDTDAAAQVAAAEDKKDAKHDHDDDAHHAKADAWAEVKPAAAAPKEMQVTGTVKFAKAEHGVKVMVDLKGLTPNAKHGFHIHEKGDLSDPKLVSAGPHFNPGGKKHGGPEGDERHGGDLGNVTADDKGHAKVEIMAHGVTLDGEKDGIVGRSVVVHAKPDDEKTDPSGNSGDRIAGGVIEKPKADAGKSADAGTATGAEAGAAQTAAAQQPAAAETAELNK